MSDTWVYHPKQEAKVVSFQEASKLYDEGWFDTPAKFPAENKNDIACDQKQEDSMGDSEDKNLIVRKRGRPPKID